MVLRNGVRHNVPNMDTLDGLEVVPEQWITITSGDLSIFPEGEPLAPCDKSVVPNTCKDSVYYKAFHKSQ